MNALFSQEPTPSTFNSHSLFVSSGVQISDATLLQPSLQLRFGYRYAFLAKWNIETAYSFSGENSIYRMRLVGVGAAMSVQAGRNNTGDILVNFLPSDSWKIGGGIQVRQMVYNSIFARYPFAGDTQVDHLFEFRIGAQAMIEYSFSLGQINFGIRGNCAYFLPPFAGDAYIGRENFVNFPANPQAKMTVAPFLSPQEYFSQSIQSFPFSVSIGVIAYIGF